MNRAAADLAEAAPSRRRDVMHQYCVVGGGIIGLATAAEIKARDPAASVVLVEKEASLGAHQTGHNSGVIHAGIYYAPGSLKARLCREGAEATKAFCRATGIPFETCGKLLVATDELELARMEALKGRAAENGIEIEAVSAERLRRLEPHVVGLGAILVPATGIVDYRRILPRPRRAAEGAGSRVPPAPARSPASSRDPPASRSGWPEARGSEPGGSSPARACSRIGSPGSAD